MGQRVIKFIQSKMDLPFVIISKEFVRPPRGRKINLIDPKPCELIMVKMKVG